MSVINNNLSGPAANTFASSADLLGRSLARLAAGSPVPDSTVATSVVAGSPQTDVTASRLQTAAAAAQDSLSSLQTADGYLGGMTGLLARLNDLASLAQSGAASSADTAQYQQEFTALQDQLRATIGGGSAVIGGPGGVNPPLGTFNGAALFGPGQGSGAGSANLQQGPMLALINQDSTGAFTLGVSDPSAGADVAGATQQVAAARTSLASTQNQLGLAVAKLQVERQNLLSAFSPIADPDAAAQSNQSAQQSILGQPGMAALTQASLNPSSVLSLVQG